MKRILLSLIVLCLFVFRIGAQSDPVTKITLKDAISYAYDNDLTLQNARLNILDAEQQILERRADGLPQINGSVDFQHYLKVPTSVLPAAFEELIKIGNGGMLPDGFSNQAQFALKNNFNVGASLNTMILDGSYFIGLQAARLYREYVSQDVVVQERSLRDRVTDAYLPSLIAVENRKILAKNITNLEKMLDETQKTYEAGFVEQLDVDRLTLSLANLQTEMENLDRQVEVLVNLLKFQIGYPQDQPLELTDNIDILLTEASGEELTGNISYYNRPEYRLAEIGLQLNDIDLRYRKAGYWPTLSGSANYQYGYQGNSLFGDDGFWVPTSLVGINLRIPIFDGFRRRSGIERAKLAKTIAQNQKQNLERLINLEVDNARTAYISAKERVASRKNNLDLAERIYNTTQIKYREGVGSSIEVTQAEQALYESQQNYTQALFELLQAKTDLDQALGK